MFKHAIFVSHFLSTWDYKYMPMHLFYKGFFLFNPYIGLHKANIYLNKAWFISFSTYRSYFGATSKKFCLIPNPESFILVFKILNPCQVYVYIICILVEVWFCFLGSFSQNFYPFNYSCFECCQMAFLSELI